MYTISSNSPGHTIRRGSAAQNRTRGIHGRSWHPQRTRSLIIRDVKDEYLSRQLDIPDFQPYAASQHSPDRLNARCTESWLEQSQGARDERHLAESAARFTKTRRPPRTDRELTIEALLKCTKTRDCAEMKGRLQGSGNCCCRYKGSIRTALATCVWHRGQ